MIRKYDFGEHYDTQAVVVSVENGDTLPFFTIDEPEGKKIFTGNLEKEDAVYGLGETTGKINKRGQKFISYNSDNPKHRPETLSLYASHNFIVIDGKKHMGFFFDTPARVIWDLGNTSPDVLQVTCDRSVTVYVVEGSSALDVTRQFLQVIGRSFIPPLWAFGFGQSRWGYKNEKDITKVVQKHQQSDFPLDYVCMDIDYMEKFIDFTINEKRFPQFQQYVADMKEQGIHLVPIIDAGVKIEPGNETFESGVKNGYFCKDKDGQEFQAAVWPGLTHFPDFFQLEARQWFGQHYHVLTDKGIEGFWNDMNEPSIFYTNKRKRGGKVDVLEGEDNNFQPGIRICDYKDFYHKIGDKQVVHHDVHNVFGYLMTRSASEELEKLLDHRFLLFSRSSYIGAHRYGGIWTGDNTSSWDNLRMNIRQMPSLNMCGFQFCGADTGGFMGNTNRELLLRWLAFSAFTPLMRDHCAKYFKNQECYRFKGKEDFQSILTLRYRMLPYLYSEYMKAVLNQDMYMKPLAFVYPEDQMAKKVEDQLMVGENLMIAPLVQEGQNQRQVYVPQTMTMVKYDGHDFSCQKVEKGNISITAELNQAVFFVPEGKAVPIGTPCKNTRDMKHQTLKLYGDGDSYELYQDDGLTRDYGNQHLATLTK